MTIRRIAACLSFVLSFYFAYHNRNRIIRLFVRRKWLWKGLIGFVMQIPPLRDQILNTVLTYRNRQEC